jgi:hypothetical protein
MGDQPSGQAAQPRINTRKLAAILLLGLLLPVTAALAVDLTIGTLPTVSIVAIVVCFPTAAILISRTVLHELDRVIQEVAPPESDVETQQEPG